MCRLVVGRDMDTALVRAACVMWSSSRAIPPTGSVVTDHFVPLLHLQQTDDNAIVIADDDVNSCDVYDTYSSINNDAVRQTPPPSGPLPTWWWSLEFLL